MIKRFISKGILGIPDMDIELGSEKIVVIKGPNGSGKTSLLRQITHPLSSHDRFNRLREGEEEGFIVMYIEYKSTMYKIQHLYSIKNNKVKVLSYISKKVNGNYMELTGNGLPSKFTEIVKYEFGYEKYLFDILNIGVANKGIIDGTNSDRVEYLKKILKLDELDKIKASVLDSIKEKNATFKYVKSKLEEFLPANKLKDRVNEIKDKTKSLNLIISTKQKELDKYKLDDGNTSELEDKVSKLNIAKRDLSNIYNLLEKEKDTNITYGRIITRYESKINAIDKKLVAYDTKVDMINRDIMNIKIVDNTKIQNNKKDLENSIKKYKDKYINCKLHYKYELEDLEKLKSYCESAMEVASSYSYDILDRYKNNYRNDYRNIIKEVKNKILDLKETIADNKNKLETINLSASLINKTFPKECKIHACELRVELSRQLEELDVHNLLKDKIEKDTELLAELENEIDDRKEIYRIIQGTDNRFNEYKFKYSYIDLPNIFDNITNDIFYLKDTIDYKSNVKELKRLDEILKLNDDNGINKKNKLLKELSKYKELKNTELNNRIKLNDELDNIKLDLSDHNFSYLTIEEVNSKLNTVNLNIANITSELRKRTSLAITIAGLEDEIHTNKLELQKITDEYYSLKLQYEESKKYTNEYDILSKDIDDLNIIREVVNKKLPGKIIENYLYDIASSVNNLLSDFLTIRFDTTDGIEIAVNREGIERSANSLSQGEKSILSMALLLAFKKNIPWDIISFDELDATLDETNKSKFIYMLRDFSELIQSLKQIFIVTHMEVSEDGMDTKIINL